MKKMKCYECGKGVVRPLAKPGRMERHKTMTLELPDHIAIPTCNKCGAEWMDEDTASMITDALERVYVRRLHEIFGESVEKITHEVAIGKLEDLLGLTRGYASRVISGKKDPSPALVSHLALIARDPKKSIKTLESVWR